MRCPRPDQSFGDYSKVTELLRTLISLHVIQEVFMSARGGKSSNPYTVNLVKEVSHQLSVVSACIDPISSFIRTSVKSWIISLLLLIQGTLLNWSKVNSKLLFIHCCSIKFATIHTHYHM